MLLLLSPRKGLQRRASLMLLAAVLLCIAHVSASPPGCVRMPLFASLLVLAGLLLTQAHSLATAAPDAVRNCPRDIDCAKEGRHLCKHGSSHCGPCLSSLVENEEGHCVARKKHHQHGKVTPYHDPDEEIDYLHSVIEKQEVLEITPPKKEPQLLAAITSQTDVKESKTDASVHKQKAQDRQSDKSVRLNAESTAPNTTTMTPQPRATGLKGRSGPIALPTPNNDNVIVIMISLCVVVGTVAILLATVCYVKLQKESRLAQKVDYPAFRETGVPAVQANGASMGDTTLAQSAQMYHYQHQKQQMLSVGNHKPEQKVPDNEVTSDEEEVGGDFTVYECPGLAPTGEMEVKNPLFDDSTINYQGNHK